jgi:hypothetical protein
MRQRESGERKRARGRAGKDRSQGPEREPASSERRRRGIDPFGGERPGGGSGGSSPTEDAFLDAFGRGREENDDPFFERAVGTDLTDGERERRGSRRRAERGGERAGRDGQATS